METKNKSRLRTLIPKIKNSKTNKDNVGNNLLKRKMSSTSFFS